MGWLAGLAVAAFICWATLDICRTLKRRRLEDSRPVYEHTPNVRVIDKPVTFYDQEAEG